MKQLTCPRCGVVVGDAVYQRWPGKLTITSPEGYRIPTLSVGVQVRLAKQRLAAAPPDEHDEAAARLRFLRDNVSELIYDIRCRNGHSTLRTMPQLVRALRRTPGQWVSIG